MSNLKTPLIEKSTTLNYLSKIESKALDHVESILESLGLGTKLEEKQIERMQLAIERIQTENEKLEKSFQ